ncbi:hypothetical protein NQ317_015104 [Molorchus minor]|uniref:Uncharacterized protein n=1 Tax=Molorchus minor TaxID=1323400 RepID=A0ABQ9K4T5_9CUCU|nr:hypothetical protein NQ317_015104 [Molorchus minor]
MRNEDSLIPEEVFLTRNPSPVAVKVTIPMMPEKSEWKLTGQDDEFHAAVIGDRGQFEGEIAGRDKHGTCQAEVVLRCFTQV